MPAVIELAQHASCHTATFPLCHFGADWQKFTTLMFTPGMQRLRELDGILCSHQTYKRNDDAKQFYQLPDEVVLAVDVTCTLMIFWIVARVDCGLVVKR